MTQGLATAASAAGTITALSWRRGLFAAMEASTASPISGWVQLRMAAAMSLCQQSDPPNLLRDFNQSRCLGILG